MDHSFLALKIHLQSYGALRPEAWHRITTLITTLQLKPGQHLIREMGSLTYLATGLMKEFDVHERLKPTILNFFGVGETVYCITKSHRLYLEAILPTTLFSLDLVALHTLHLEFEELIKIYRNLRYNYYEKLLLRMFLLEMPPRKRIIHFRQTHQTLLPFLQKKEMCNYLHLDYDYFVRTYRKLS